jgi:hypothetical protein
MCSADSTLWIDGDGFPACDEIVDEWQLAAAAKPEGDER